MQFRRNGLRDERRRRALVEDRAGDVTGRRDAADTVVGAKAPPRTYSKTAIDERRVRIVDAVPVYPVHVAILYVACGLLIAGLLALHHYVGNLIRWADLARVDSLGTWFAAGVLAAAAMTAILIFRIRRHRLDDYRGRYRCWLWFAGLLLFASLDTVLNFRSDVAIGLESLTQLRLLGRTDAWWAAVWTLAFGAMTLRAALEVRESRGTLFVGMLSATLLATGMGLQLNLLLLPANMSADLILHAARFAGLGLLMAALVQYARYVWLDAQGLIVRETAAVFAAEKDHQSDAPAKSRVRRQTAKKPVEDTKRAKVADATSEETKDESPPARSRGWFGFGRKHSVEELAADDGDETPSKDAAKAELAKRVAARKTNQKADAPVIHGNKESEDAAKPKRGWFSLGRSKPAAEEESQDEKQVKSVTSKPPQASRPLAQKVAKRSTTEEADDADEGAPASRSWFSFGRKRNPEGEVAEEKAASAKPKKVAAKVVEQEESAEKPTRKSWFGWGKQAPSEDEAADAEADRKTMTPRITTRPKGASPAPAAAPPASSSPTIHGKYSQVDEDDDYENDSYDGGADSGDEEILRLESKPEHLLSKAERRRLKKLKRRAA